MARQPTSRQVILNAMKARCRDQLNNAGVVDFLVLCGSTYTLDMLASIFKQAKVELEKEMGESFIPVPKAWFDFRDGRHTKTSPETHGPQFVAHGYGKRAYGFITYEKATKAMVSHYQDDCIDTQMKGLGKRRVDTIIATVRAGKEDSLGNGVVSNGHLLRADDQRLPAPAPVPVLPKP